MIANLQERKISVPPSAPTPTTPHPPSFLGHLTGTTSQSAGPDTGGWQCPAPTPRPAHCWRAGGIAKSISWTQSRSHSRNAPSLPACLPEPAAVTRDPAASGKPSPAGRRERAPRHVALCARQTGPRGTIVVQHIANIYSKAGRGDSTVALKPQRPSEAKRKERRGSQERRERRGWLQVPPGPSVRRLWTLRNRSP